MYHDIHCPLRWLNSCVQFCDSPGIYINNSGIYVVSIKVVGDVIKLARDKKFILVVISCKRV